MELALSQRLRNVSESFVSRQRLSLAGRFEELRRPLFRNAYALALNDAGNAGLGYVYWLLAARLFTTDQVGFGSALIAAQQLLSGIAALRLSGALLRFLPRAGKQAGKLIGISYALSLVGATITASAFVLGVGWWAPALSFIRDNSWLATWFVLAVMMWCIFGLQDVVLTSLRRTLIVPLENALFGLMKLGLLFIAVPLGNFGIFASWTIPVALSLVPINWLIARRYIPRHAEASGDRAIAFGAKDVISHLGREYASYVLGLLANTALPLMIVQRAGATANAYFYMAWLVSSSLHLVAVNMVQSLTVEVAFNQDQLASYLRTMLTHIARLVVPAVLLVVIGAPLLLAVFGQGYSSGGTTTLRLLALAAIPNVLNATYTGVARAQGRLNGVVVLNAALSAGVLGVSYVLLPQFGIESVGAIWLISQSLIAAVLGVAWLRPLLGAATA